MDGVANGFGVPPQRYPWVRPGVGHDLCLGWVGMVGSGR